MVKVKNYFLLCLLFVPYCLFSMNNQTNMKKLVECEIKKFENVTAEGIDLLLDKKRIILGLSESVSELVKQMGREEYASKKKIAERISYIPLDPKEDIHWMPLFGHTMDVDLHRNKLSLSSDSKYVRAIDSDFNVFIWNTETGELVSLYDSEIVWQNRRPSDLLYSQQSICNISETCFVVQGYAPIYGPRELYEIDYNPRKKRNEPALLLMRRPTVESSLCQDVFKRSKMNQEALMALLHSESVKNLAGLPGLKLQYLIQKQLEALKAQQAKL
jgi:hypothetical protein